MAKFVPQEELSLVDQVKIRREKQLNRQMELNAELKRLKRELQQLQ